MDQDDNDNKEKEERRKKDKEEENKIAYLEYKNELEQRDIFNGEETLDFNVYFNIERVDEEITDYSLVIDTP